MNTLQSYGDPAGYIINMQPGESVAYGQVRTGPDWNTQIDIRAVMWALYQAGVVSLVQRVTGPASENMKRYTIYEAQRRYIKPADREEKHKAIRRAFAKLNSPQGIFEGNRE